MSVNIVSRTKKIPILIIIASLLLLVVSGTIWWLFIYKPDPNKVFWQMMENSLSTESVTIESQQEQQGVSIRQVMRYQLGATNQAHSATVITQGGTKVKTEMVATPTVDYTRYTEITTDNTGADGKPLDFSKSLNTWAKGEENRGELFSQAVFDNAVLHGNLSREQRDKLLTQMRTDNVYEVVKGESKTRKNKETGRLEYVYKVKVQYIPYIRLLKNFAKEVGIRSFEDLDPNSYSGTPPFETVLVVDARSRHLIAVQQTDGTESQHYSGYGVPVQIDAPKKTITDKELQDRLAVPE